MTRIPRRHLAVVLDRSGSMQKVKTDTEGGLRAFLEAQQDVPGSTTISLYQFDHDYDVVYENKPLSTVPAYSMQPRGRTSLFDAVGRTLARVGKQIAAQPEIDRPSEVIIVILTDGDDNTSHEHTLRSVKDLITLRQKEHGWHFVFLGADQDAFAAAGSMGIARNTTLSYASDQTQDTLARASKMIARGTNTGTWAFTQDEREATS